MFLSLNSSQDVKTTIVKKVTVTLDLQDLVNINDIAFFDLAHKML